MTRAERVRDYAMEEVTEEGEKGRQRRRPLSYRERKHCWEGAPPSPHGPRTTGAAEGAGPSPRGWRGWG